MDKLSGVDIIQLVIDIFVEYNVTNINYLLLTKNLNIINIPRTISYQITDVSTRLQFLKLRNIINKWVGSTALCFYIGDI